MTQQATIHIRNAKEQDLHNILEIYNDAVLNTLAIWNEQIVDIENRREWLLARQKSGYPVLIADENGQTLGYASYGPFRPFEGDRFSAEISIYVHKNARAKGLGKQLLKQLIEHATHNNIHILIAAIEAGNHASIKLHQNFGFIETARMPEIGFKYGQWLDLVMLQRQLS